MEIALYVVLCVVLLEYTNKRLTEENAMECQRLKILLKFVILLSFFFVRSFVRGNILIRDEKQKKIRTSWLAD